VPVEPTVATVVALLLHVPPVVVSTRLTVLDAQTLFAAGVIAAIPEITVTGVTA
jgi:hypothetical protein